MNRTIARTLLVAALTMAAIAPVQAQSRWIAFAPPDKTFTMLMPGQPVTRQLSATDNEVPYTSHQYAANDGGMGVMVTVADFAPGASRPAAANVRDAMLKSLKAFMTSTEERSYTRAPGDVLHGIEFTAETASQTCKSDIYVDEFRVLAALVCAARGTATAAEIDRALGSFKPSPRALAG